MNRAMVTKLNWKICTASHKSWVQLICARYLMGRRMLDFEQTHQNASWIWWGLKNCSEILKKGCCYQLGRGSTSSLTDDPWIPSLAGFKLPPETTIPQNCQLTRDLMTTDGSQWDVGKIHQLFHPHISKHILETPILDREHDTLV